MSDFEDIFCDADDFFKKLTKKVFKEMKAIEEAIRSGKLEGEWDIKPLKLPKQIKDEVREPLTDVFEDRDNVKLYVELPGVEKSDIQLNVTDAHAEIKAKNFHKVIDLPTGDVEFDKASANYKNGVLEVIIPKVKKTVVEERKQTIKIE